jgi:hypothetical protein
MCPRSVTGSYTDPFHSSSAGSSQAAPLSQGHHAHAGGYITGGYVNRANCMGARMLINVTKSMIQELTYRRNSLGGSSQGKTAR